MCKKELFIPTTKEFVMNSRSKAKAATLLSAAGLLAMLGPAAAFPSNHTAPISHVVLSGDDGMSAGWSGVHPQNATFVGKGTAHYGRTYHGR